MSLDPAPAADPVAAPAADPIVNNDPAPADPPASDPPADPPADPPVEPPKSFFGEAPENWRQDAVDNMRLNDPEAATRELKRLERFKTPQDWLKATYEADRKIRKGEIQSGLPENATDEQLAEYRTAHGIPDEATGYELDLGEGVTLSDSDQAIIDTMLPAAHAANLPNDAMSGLSKAFFEARAKQAAERHTQDELDKQTTDKLLREEWQSDFQANTNIFSAFVAGLPEDARQEFSNMRGPGGKGLANNPAIINSIVDLMRKADPTVTVVPPNDGNPLKTMDDELASLNKMMSEEPDKWYKDQEAQRRWRELTDAKDRLKAQQN